MAPEDRTADNNLIQSLLEEGRSFSFFQAVYLLEQYLNDPASLDTASIKLTPFLSFGFSASDVVNIEKSQDEEKTSFTIETSFLSVYGSYSPLPSFYTEDIMWNDQARVLVKGFLDIFHHRLLSLFYRAWCKYRFYIQFKQGGSDNFSGMMLSLAGLNLSYLHDAPISQVRLLRFSGLLTQRPKSSSALKKVLNSFFSDARIAIEELVGKWISIDEEERCSLGKRGSQLGVDTSIGGRVFDRAGNIRVMVYPCAFAVFIQFLPGGGHYKELSELVTLFIPGHIDFDIELHLPQEPPEVPLKSDGMMRLGFTSRLGSGTGGERSIVFS